MQKSNAEYIIEYLKSRPLMSFALTALFLVATAYFTYLLGEAFGRFLYYAYEWLSALS